MEQTAPQPVKQLAEKLIAVDGKTMRGNRQNEERPQHIVTAYAVDLGQRAIEEKSNEITAIPLLLKSLVLTGATITSDAMGTQTELAEQINKQRGKYILAVKGNQGALYEEIKDYLEDRLFEKEWRKKKENYVRTVESARSQVETKEYYQTNKIQWMEEKKRWKGLKTIGKVGTTIEKKGEVSQETRYYISSCPLDITYFQRAVRGHWGIESMHWHLDVTFREDANHTLNKNAARNLNIIRKMSLPFLKSLSDEKILKHASMRKHRFWLSMNFPYYLGVFYERYVAH